MHRPTTITALALASLLAVAGCAEESEETAGGSAPEATASSSAATSTATDSASASAAGAGISDEHNDADTMFAQMMIPHHEQAVTMSQTLLAKDGIDQEVRNRAERIADTQEPEIEQMQQMLEAWDEPTSMESEGMEGMDHGSMGPESGSGMGGMMTEEDMDQLMGTEGNDAAALFLEQMIEHHRGAIEMAQDQVDNGENPQAIELARDVVEDQQAEIAEMDQLLQSLPSQS